MRSPSVRRYAALAALSAGVLITAGCGWGGGGGGENAPGAKDLHFQPVAAPGPDPFTASTAAPPPAGASSAASSSSSSSSSSSPNARGARDARDAPGGGSGAVRTPRVLPGSTPGLYGGSPSASCDVERQVRLLTEDRAKARAFARGTGIDQASVPEFLRGLTPVVLRADIRVTAHGYRAGASAPFQSVLQTGTAVMVDEYGLPRVRCSGGNPLGGPVAVKGAVSYRGTPWRGYLSDRVVVIERAPRPLDSLVVVDLVGHTWTERRTGTDGGEDRAPETPPSYSPDADLTDPEAVRAPDTVAPSAPAPGTDAPPDRPLPREEAPLPRDAAPDQDPGAGLEAGPDTGPDTGPDADFGADPGTDPGADPGGDEFSLSDDGLPPPAPDGEQPGDDLAGFDTFAG